MDRRETANSNVWQNQRAPYKSGEKEENSSDSSKEGSDSSDSIELSGDSSEGVTFNDKEQKMPVTSSGNRGEGDTFNDDERQSNAANNTTRYKESIEIPRRTSLPRSDRQKRLEHARSRAAKRNSVG